MENAKTETGILINTVHETSVISLCCAVDESHLNSVDPHQSMLENTVTGLVLARQAVVAPVGGSD